MVENQTFLLSGLLIVENLNDIGHWGFVTVENQAVSANGDPDG